MILIKDNFNILIILALVAVILATNACDQRGLGPPKIEVEVPGFEVESLSHSVIFNHRNNETSNITLRLTGLNPDTYAEKRIDFSYNTQYLQLMIQGEEMSCYTDKYGVAAGVIRAKVGVDGVLQSHSIQFRVRQFPDVKQTVRIEVKDPFISSMVSSAEFIPADTTSLGIITVEVTPAIENLNILFSTNSHDWAELSENSVLTTNQSLAVVSIKSKNTLTIPSMDVIVTARIEDYPSNPQTVRVTLIKSEE